MKKILLSIFLMQVVGFCSATTWYYTKEKAFAAAEKASKPIFLVWGNNGCYNTNKVRQYLNSSELKPYVDNYILWYSNQDNYGRREVVDYIGANYNLTSPICCVINAKTNKYTAKTQGMRTEKQLIETLSKNTHVANEILDIEENRVYFTGNDLIIQNNISSETISIYTTNGILVDKFKKNDCKITKETSNYPFGILTIYSSYGWSKISLKKRSFYYNTGKNSKII